MPELQRRSLEVSASFDSSVPRLWGFPSCEGQIVQETPESSDLSETFCLSGNKKVVFLGTTPDLISAVFLARG